MTTRLVICTLLFLTIRVSTTSASTSVDIQAGVASSYSYHLEGYRAVDSDDRNLAVAVQVVGQFAPRWSYLAGGVYWTDRGMVVLPKVPESPAREVASHVIPIYGGVRLRPGPLNRALALYLDIGAGLTVLRSTVREIPPSFIGELAPDDSAVDVAPLGVLAASLSLPVSSRVALAIRSAYLFSGDFANEDGLIFDRRFRGLREITLFAGCEIDVLP
jgi:hypothetical protein